MSAVARPTPEPAPVTTTTGGENFFRAMDADATNGVTARAKRKKSKNSLRPRKHLLLRERWVFVILLLFGL
jgi:hypothetical protein